MLNYQKDPEGIAGDSCRTHDDQCVDGMMLVPSVSTNKNIEYYAFNMGPEIDTSDSFVE